MSTAESNVVVDTKLVIVGHPLVQRELTRLRDCATTSEQFAQHTRRIATMLTMVATADVKTLPITVRTPLGPALGCQISGRIIIVPVLRAGLGLENGFRDVLPDAVSFHVGMVRDEITAEASTYLNKLDSIRTTDSVFLVDPMLATGGSALGTLRLIVEAGAEQSQIRMICVVAAPEGITAVRNWFPGVVIYTPVVDECLNERKYIVPGLGDFGDRLYGTLSE